MLEQRKEYQCQIRLTEEQYDYLKGQRAAKRCSTSAYFRSLLVADMNKKTKSKSAENHKGGKK